MPVNETTAENPADVVKEEPGPGGVICQLDKDDVVIGFYTPSSERPQTTQTDLGELRRIMREQWDIGCEDDSTIIRAAADEIERLRAALCGAEVKLDVVDRSWSPDEIVDYARGALEIVRRALRIET